MIKFLPYEETLGINLVQDVLRPTVATYVFQIQWGRPKEIIHFLKAGYVLPVLLKKPTGNEKRPEIPKKPAANDRADDDSHKNAK